MWTISQIICMGGLLWLSIVDIRYRTIPIEPLVMGNIISLMYQVLTRQMNLWLVVGGVCVGAAFLFISFITHESIGYGDSWLILILGIYLGLWGVLEVLMGALLALALVSIIVLIIKKLSRRCVIPFIPFLAAGYLMSVLAGA